MKAIATKRDGAFIVKQRRHRAARDSRSALRYSATALAVMLAATLVLNGAMGQESSVKCAEGAVLPKGVAVSQEPPDYASQVEVLYQYPLFPSGCEAHSLAMILRAYGYNADPAELIDRYMPTDPTWSDYVHHFAGDARGAGSAMPPAVVACAQAYVQANGGGETVDDLTGSSWEDILDIVQGGCPVALWTTLDMSAPQFTGAVQEGYSYYSNLHCVVLYGIGDSGTVLVADPIGGYREYPREDLAWIYEACGSMALAVRRG